MTPAPTRVDRRARGAVAVLFVVNGATYNGIVGWFPTLRDALGLSNAELGTAVAAFPGAALVVGGLAGPLIARFGGGRVAVVVGVLGALARLGVLAVPPAIGSLADAYSVSVGLVLVPCAALGAALLAGSLRHREEAPPSGDR